ncbi:isopenicillin N synthase family oxygenase [Phytobacter diazotrophicus]|uniref:2-oxoglutarate-dependent ethylene/succinate-forming enzyme n=1 Tax=Phytobacter diazotrophicus TaxID=395631 RepID=A0ABN6LU10_9ENTR|nr:MULTISPECIES: isopenicillin N synthase family oxygenase [Phytobacter]MDU4150608.1 isopenicillin N synthase family oxygenase [Enterobacteriaceae bacterium]QIH64856.1 isopenicillin N synthase family oxygenase [Enterobacteriaceae bacterium A-F18]MDU4352843.1 isopenicillin N synthase family oxygenase [Phytobacter diazotrophicus]MDU7133067.1 isopenicillin N synthase family oxygenase [Enterobacteriaceae bacterium]MDU7198734.1 isopenicillin N synthase family oxygenase [Enterobacteriaceae bacterium
MNATTLPILDLARYFNPAEREAFLDQLRTSARDIGFFYLINHGVNDELQRAVQHEARRFFALSDEQKQQVAMIHSPHFRGYNRAASEITRGKPDWREQFDIGAERPELLLSDSDPRWRRLQGPNLWPAEQPELKTTLLDWQKSMTEMAIVLLRAFAEALRLPANAFDALYGDKPNEHIKLIRYPGQDNTQSNQGVGAHKDSGFLSFLLQDEQKGLQVEVSPDHWIDAVPLPGSFVVNIGELLELATNGYLRATVHRVVSPPAGQDRLSIAFFLGAQLDAVVPVYALPEALAREAQGPESDPQNPLLRDVGWNYLKGRLRSHPDVAERYYRDVLRERSEQLIV